MSSENAVSTSVKLTEVDQAAIREAAAVLRQGGVVAYPTEAVWGLGCDPFNSRAVQRLLLLKQRDPSKGVILIAASMEQLKPWLTGLSAEHKLQLQQSWPGPQTWLVEDNGYTPELIRGKHTKVALRVTDHPWVVALCEAFGGPLVSTSANMAGEPPLCTHQEVMAAFGQDVDAVLDGPLGGLERPSRITDLATGEVLRA
ncbi:L-threonylcarbamoyladenylate synthase [Marinospirillum alkaliphilum]|uniref:Threonylcarbamoyl-AMP synthase n=1 Tax=Marinospirillum alkaliphilum DSM 21637 TaxID=1122209 RepID=A0A1K1ZWR7_9GAMM|nr:L-threonylcarbamoyladenylate synthase [Marinospirillum alkaliphilum]SFX78567.1 L-threonylcarbamoyladenylate synthase [Marinospirillum alkaliphilum DSM 21637]